MDGSHQKRINTQAVCGTLPDAQNEYSRNVRRCFLAKRLPFLLYILPEFGQRLRQQSVPLFVLTLIAVLFCKSHISCTP